MEIHVNKIDGKIILTFPKSVTWLSFTEAELEAFIATLRAIESGG